MSNKILFLYTDSRLKKELGYCLEAIKAVFRKFRKTAEIEFLELDMSLSCESSVKKLLFPKINSSNAVIWALSSQHYFEEELFAIKNLGIYSGVDFCSGKYICYPFSLSEEKQTEKELSKKQTITLSHIEKTATLALDICSIDKSGLLLCSDSFTKTDHFIQNSLENFTGGRHHIKISHSTLEEVIYTFLRTLPSERVIFTTRENARVLSVHINSMNKFPAGFTVWHGDKTRIYTRNILPYENENIAYTSLLLSLGNLIENELGIKSVGVHLRRCAVLSLEKCTNMKLEDFQSQLISEINMPIRNRRVNTDESYN